MALPSVSKLDSDNFPTFWLTVTTDIYDDMSLTRIVQNDIIDVLEKLSTIGKANLYGDKIYTMRVEPIPIKMQQYKISPTEIEAAIRKQNKDYPAGEIKTDFRNFTLRLKGILTSAEEFGNIILNAQDGNTIKLRDVTQVLFSTFGE